jgi:peptidoglycan/xylan/chitin deacetylase (PgdA/CDA1 family)
MRTISLLFHDVYRTQPDESGFVSAAANRYKLALTDFEAQLDGIACARSDSPVLMGSSENRVEAQTLSGSAPFVITVDDGGVSYYTTVAERLEERGWRGHCFVTTDFIDSDGFLSRGQIRELADRGHIIGSHSASHPARFNSLPFHQLASEWARSRATLEDILGRPVDVGSVPGGYYSPVVARAAREAGIRVLFTSEPVTRVDVRHGCLLAGRFTIRRGDPNDLPRRLVSTSPAARSVAWASWNAKGLVKPLLGRSYTRIADWLLAEPPAAQPARAKLTDAKLADAHLADGVPQP